MFTKATAFVSVGTSFATLYLRRSAASVRERASIQSHIFCLGGLIRTRMRKLSAQRPLAYSEPLLRHGRRHDRLSAVADMTSRVARRESEMVGARAQQSYPGSFFFSLLRIVFEILILP